jgi:hypothetical protein
LNAVEQETTDSLSIYGRKEPEKLTKTTIKEKDMIYESVFDSKRDSDNWKNSNATPYVRLKRVMDYWCSLWFWPLEEADKLPDRGTFLTYVKCLLGAQSVVWDSMDVFNERRRREKIKKKSAVVGKILDNISKIYEDAERVNMATIHEHSESLNIAERISEEQHFFHWELNFANIFKDKGGFDLILGNPPWVNPIWEERGVLSEQNPMFAIRNLNATEIAVKRNEALKNSKTKLLYLHEYENITGMQKFLGSPHNYDLLKGMKTNLYKCFLPQAWDNVNNSGIVALLHPEGIYDDPQGSELREKVYERLLYHFQFENRKGLFSDVDGHVKFSVNIYGPTHKCDFKSISNLYDPSTIGQCEDDSIITEVSGIKDTDNNWNSKGHPDRIVNISKEELKLFAKVFDGSPKWMSARLPCIHAATLLEILKMFAKQEVTIQSLDKRSLSTQFWNETNAQMEGTIEQVVHFPDNALETIYSGPLIGVSNPLYKCARSVCKVNSDFDTIDLTNITDDYLQRVKYAPKCDLSVYSQRVPDGLNGHKANAVYRLVARRRLNLSSERTLMSCLIPKGSCHIGGVISFEFADKDILLILLGTFSSLPFDFFIKIFGKTDLHEDNAELLPIITSKYNNAIIGRALLLNCLTTHYASFWNDNFDAKYFEVWWSKSDKRLSQSRFTNVSNVWDRNIPLRTDFERRQALVEIDVLTAMALGITLEQLLTMYRIQFPILKDNETNTYYDRNGRIVFTKNAGLTNVGYSAREKEYWDKIKNKACGKFSRTYTDDTMPGGPVERTIEYEAPFTRCSREDDYASSWAFFSAKFANIE